MVVVHDLGTGLYIIIHLLKTTLFFLYRMDCTLRELMSLVKEVNPELRAKGTMFSFATIYPDPRRGVFRLKELGQTISGRKGSDDNITLHSRRFQIGDYLDVAVSTRPPSGARRDSRSRPY